MADLKGALAKKAETSVATAGNNPANQIQSYLARMAPEIAKACGSMIKADELGRVALTTIRLNPKLMECNIQSLMAGVMMAAQLGLRIDPTLGQAYLVPYGKEAQFILGYRGMLALIRNSGEVSNIMAYPVYQNDHFVLQYGLEEKLDHTPWHCREDKAQTKGGEFRGAYCVARLKDGGSAHLYMPKADIDAHRKRSKASGSGPWVTDYEAMALKTVVRGISKWLPMSIDDYRKISANDETVKTELAPDMSEVTDITADQQPVNVGQIADNSTGEVSMSDDEKKDVTDTTTLLQEVYALITKLAEVRGDSPDDTISSLTNDKLSCLIDLEDKPVPYLNDIKLMVKEELNKGTQA